MRYTHPISIIILMLLVSMSRSSFSAADVDTSATFAGDSWTWDGETVEITIDGATMSMAGRVALVYENNELQNGDKYEDLDTLPPAYQSAYLQSVLGWQPVLQFGVYHIEGPVSDPEYTSSFVIVFDTNGNKYVPVPKEIQDALQSTPTPERPPPRAGMS